MMWCLMSNECGQRQLQRPSARCCWLYSLSSQSWWRLYGRVLVTSSLPSMIWTCFIQGRAFHARALVIDSIYWSMYTLCYITYKWSYSSFALKTSVSMKNWVCWLRTKAYNYCSLLSQSKVNRSHCKQLNYYLLEQYAVLAVLRRVRQ